MAVVHRCDTEVIDIENRGAVASALDHASRSASNAIVVNPNKNGVTRRVRKGDKRCWDNRFLVDIGRNGLKQARVSERDVMDLDRGLCWGFFETASTLRHTLSKGDSQK